MFNSLLNAGNLSIDSLILDIFIILGVVIAGALIVYFLWEAVSAIVSKAKKSETSTNEPVFKDVKKSPKKEDVFVADYKLDEEVVKEEESVVEPLNLIDESKIVEVDEAKAEEEKAKIEENAVDEERENAERRAYLEARRQELIRRMQSEMQEVEEPEVSEEVESVEEEVSEIEELPEIEEDESVEEIEEIVDEQTEVEENQVDALQEERKALEAEKDRYETMVRELEEAKKSLAEQTKEVAPIAHIVSGNAPSLEELQEKLEIAEERLRATEKEFKQCKKEFIPLRRVWKTHEKDDNKLRRKEALVAKQKVMLYGVNNYADIDEDKAKKLAEDLDLLDGLKLSVQHCEEVMKKNEERYPLLEKMYNVLSLRNEELKNDIANIKSQIAAVEAEQNTDTESAE